LATVQALPVAALVQPLATPVIALQVGAILGLEEGDATTRFHHRNCQFVAMEAAAKVNGQRLIFLDVGTETMLEATFTSLQSRGVDALLITLNPFYEGRRDQIVALAKSHAVLVVYPWREYSVIGGLVSYGTNFTESYRQAGVYVGRILKGEKPADLPVVQATKFELVLNVKTAKALGLTVPPSLLVATDEVIE
jgi:putative ABC transport system substrate-binding protein